MHLDHLTTDPDNVPADTCTACGNDITRHDRDEDNYTYGRGGFPWPEYRHDVCPEG